MKGEKKYDTDSVIIIFTKMNLTFKNYLQMFQNFDCRCCHFGSCLASCMLLGCDLKKVPLLLFQTLGDLLGHFEATQKTFRFQMMSFFALISQDHQLPMNHIVWFTCAARLLSCFHNGAIPEHHPWLNFKHY